MDRYRRQSETYERSTPMSRANKVSEALAAQYECQAFQAQEQGVRRVEQVRLGRYALEYLVGEWVITHGSGVYHL